MTTKRKVSRKPKNQSRATVARVAKPVDASQAGAKLADTVLASLEASIEQMPENARHATIEGLIARLEELAPGDAKAGTASQSTSPWQLTGAAFDGSELRPDTTPADLFSLLWHYPDVADDDILTAALKSAEDDFEIVGAALASGHDISDPLQGFLLRAEWRLRVAREVHKRINAVRVAAVVTGGAS